MRLRSWKLHEIVRTSHPEDHADERWESSPGGVMHDGWCGKLIQRVTSLKPATTSGDHVSDPLAISPIGKRDQECVGPSKDLHWRSVNPTRLSTHLRNNTEAGQSGSESAHDPVRNNAIEGHALERTNHR